MLSLVFLQANLVDFQRVPLVVVDCCIFFLQSSVLSLLSVLSVVLFGCGVMAARHNFSCQVSPVETITSLGLFILSPEGFRPRISTRCT